MPRRSRIDAVGALHHIMARGIEGREVFRSYAVRDHFVARFGGILQETEALCCAWYQTILYVELNITRAPPSSQWSDSDCIYNAEVFDRFGYAIRFNPAFGGKQNLFQNRYKSIPTSTLTRSGTE
jgi:hypothetical protein